MPTPCPELNPPERILMGPGPSNVHPRVLRMMSLSPLGHMDPEFFKIMDEVMGLLRSVFQTDNRLTIVTPGTGSSGMEAAICNVVEPDDRVVACVAGYFGERVCDMVERCGAELTREEAEWGAAVNPDRAAEVIDEVKPDVVILVHAETSTGVCQAVETISEAARRHGALVVADAVTSLGGSPTKIDDRGIDVCYSCTQKCIGAPPGLAPVSFNERAMGKVRARKTKIRNWYLDITLLEKYWSEERAYHHTAPVNLVYALHEALRLIEQEGLEARFKRHELNHCALVAGLEAMGLSLLPPKEDRLWMLNAVRIPEGVDDAVVRGRLLVEHNIEIGSGLGQLKGRIWRIGIMGYSCNRNNVLLLLSALERILAEEGYQAPAGAGIEAASAMYAQG